MLYGAGPRSNASTARDGLDGSALNTDAILVILLTGVGCLYSAEALPTKASVKTIKTASKGCLVWESVDRHDTKGIEFGI